MAVLTGPAAAQDVGLKKGEESLNAGNFSTAAQQLSATVNDKRATINQVAKALYLRGIAYRRAGYPGQAASDLGAALWLGLSPSEKARAYVNKGLAFQAAGMESQSASAMAQARRYSSSSTVQKLIAQDGGVGPVATGGIASFVPSVPSMPSLPSLPSANNVLESVIPSFGGNKNATTATQSATAGSAASSGTAASAPAAAPQAAPTSGWDASVNEGSGGNAVSRWWGNVTGGGAAATAPQAASSGSASTSSSTASAPPAATQSAPTSGWDASVNEGSGGNAVSRWWGNVTGGGSQ